VRKPFIAALALGIIAFTTAAAFACGDKLVLIGSFGRFHQVNAGLHPASVLAYAPQNSPLPEVVRDLQSQAALKRAGHKFYAVGDSAELDEALKTGKYDLLLADATDAEILEHQVQSAPSMPTVLPVVYKSSKAEANAVEKRFHCVLKAPASPSNYIAAIDEAMALKLKNR
jgi:hypothetical protein